MRVARLVVRRSLTTVRVPGASEGVVRLKPLATTVTRQGLSVRSATARYRRFASDRTPVTRIETWQGRATSGAGDGKTDPSGSGEGDEPGPGPGDGPGDGEGLGLGEGDGLGLGEGDGLGLGEGDGLGLGEGEGLGVGDGLGVGLGV